MILYKLKKKYAKTNVCFVENLQMDAVDKWFIDINSINKSGVIKSCITIIKPDLKKWLDSYLREGWIIDDENPKI